MDTTLVIALVVVLAIVVAVFVIYAISRSRQTPAGPAPRAEAPPKGLRERLARSRTALTSSLAGVFSSDALDDDVWEELEDALISADVGPTTAVDVVEAVRDSKPEDAAAARDALEEQLIDALDRPDRGLHLDASPAVVVVVGVNGTGKTTSIAKIAHHLVGDGHSVVLGAADTFRAAADAQLRTWGDRVGVPVVSGQQGADPASVAYDAVRRAQDAGADAVIIDTAGRLHSQSNLMDELTKIVRILERESGIDEVLLVLDGTVGQNGIAQAKAFTDAVGVTGVVLTKLDGTARGGIAIAVEKELDVPVKLIGVGEGMDDLIEFVPRDFVEALVAP